MLPHTTSNNLSVKDIKLLPVSNLQSGSTHLFVGVSNQPGDGTGILLMRLKGRGKSVLVHFWRLTELELKPPVFQSSALT